MALTYISPTVAIPNASIANGKRTKKCAEDCMLTSHKVHIAPEEKSSLYLSGSDTIIVRRFLDNIKSDMFIGDFFVVISMTHTHMPFGAATWSDGLVSDRSFTVGL